MQRKIYTLKETKQQNMSDSNTWADPDEKRRKRVDLHGERTRVSIRVKPELKEALKQFCEANGLSICHVFEALVTGYLSGMKQKIDWVSQSPTIELSVVREVKRMRRYSGSMAAENYYEPSNGIWLLREGELNENGHVVGCGCLKCRGKLK